MKNILLRVLFLLIAGLFIIACSDEKIENNDYLTEPLCEGSFIPKVFNHITDGMSCLSLKSPGIK